MTNGRLHATDDDRTAAVGAALLRALAPKLDGLEKIEGLKRLSGGVSRETWSFEAITTGGEMPLILRRQSGGVVSGEDLDLPHRLEAEVLQWAAASGAPVPRVVVVLEPLAQLGEGFVMERIAGETLPRRILCEARFARARTELLGHCAAALASLRSARSPDVPRLPIRRATDLLIAYERLYRALPVARPIVELGFRWLADNVPKRSDTALVHGDFRMGNLLVDGGGLTGVIDWELAHFGDPLEDVGWFCTNAWRFDRPDRAAGGLATREDWYAAYERAGAPPVDRAHARFWEVFGCLKWAVISMRLANRHLSGAERSVELLAIGRRTAEAEMDLMNLLLSPPP